MTKFDKTMRQIRVSQMSQNFKSNLSPDMWNVWENK